MIIYAIENLWFNIDLNTLDSLTTLTTWKAITKTSTYSCGYHR